MIRHSDRYSRRAVLKGSVATLGSALFAATPFFPLPGRAAVPPGTLTAVAGTPNPAGAFDQLFWLSGDALARPVTAIAGDLPGKPLGDRTISVTLLHFNDLHNRLTDPHAKKGDTHRFAQMYKIVEDRRAARAGADEITLLFSGGDDHTGSVFDELVGWSPEEYVDDPGYATYSAAGVDAAALGNHELDRGTAVLKKGIRNAARFPVLSANLTGTNALTPGEDFFPAAIGIVKGMRIGMIGLTTPVDTHTHTEDDPDLDVDSPVRALENLLPALSDACDLVVILSHCGYGLESSRSGKAGADRFLQEGDVAVARAAAKVSRAPVIVVGGHTHTALNAGGLEAANVVDGVPIVQAGGHGSHLGELTCTLASGGMSNVAAQLHAIKKRDDRTQPDADAYRGLEHDGDYDAAFETATIAPLMAKLDEKLKAVIAQVEGAPKVDNDTIVAERYMRECAIVNFMNDALVTRSKTFPGGPVDIALFNASGIASGIPVSGPLSFQEWFAVMPFADSVQIFELTGRQIRDILDNNAKRIVRPEELKGDQAVDLHGYVSRGFLHFSSNVRYAVTLNGAASAATATRIEIGGQPIEAVLDKTFRVAMNSYVGAGAYGESWNGNPVGAGVKGGIVGYDIKSLPRHDTGLVYRNEIIARIRELGRVSPQNGAVLDGRLTVL